MRVKDSGVHSITRPNARDILRAFAPGNSPINTLKWETRLDQEDGAGVKVVLLDSGINWSNSVFTGAHIRGRDFTGNGGLFDSTYHGSANAALLVGRDTDGSKGLSPECELLVARVLGQREWKKTVVAITAALRWAIHAGTDIIILPFGTFRASASISREISIAISQGCQVFAAAGNRGPDQIYFPAWLPEVTAVSALSCDGSILPECCALDTVDLYCWGEHVPVPGHDQSIELLGSSPATVLAAGFATLKKAAQRKMISTNNRDNRKGENYAGLE